MDKKALSEYVIGICDRYLKNASESANEQTIIDNGPYGIDGNLYPEGSGGNFNGELRYTYFKQNYGVCGYSRYIKGNVSIGELQALSMLSPTSVIKIYEGDATPDVTERLTANLTALGATVNIDTNGDLSLVISQTLSSLDNVSLVQKVRIGVLTSAYILETVIKIGDIKITFGEEIWGNTAVVAASAVVVVKYLLPLVPALLEAANNMTPKLIEVFSQ